MRSFNRRTVFLWFAGFVSAAVTAQAQTSSDADIQREQEKAESLIGEIIAEERARAAPGARRLETNLALTQIARTRAAALANGTPFSHQDWEGRYPAKDMVEARFGPYGFMGENIVMEHRGARGFDAHAFAKFAVAQWMASDSHRAAILSPDFNASGIGVVVFRDQAYATQIFRGPPPPAKRERSPRPRDATSARFRDGLTSGP